MARYLSVRNVRPDEVTLADLEAYHEAILSDRLRAKPEQTWDAIVWTWNACRREVAGWPDIEIPREIRREVYVSAVVGLSTVTEGRRRCVPPSPVGRRPERGRPCASGRAGDA